jgi:hypothetical protein
MFDVSWTDPTRETVGQRKSRKDQHANSLRQTPSIRSSRSTDSSQAVAKPSLLNLFTGGKKGDLIRTGSQPKLSALRPESSKSKASRRASSYTVSSDHSSHEVSIPTTTTTRIPANNLFTGNPYQSDEQSSLSEGTCIHIHQCSTNTSQSRNQSSLDGQVVQERLNRHGARSNRPPVGADLRNL